ncbi:intracellular hyaluronan-binding protein 4-like [Plectropomus leopardus]|uniref:intracellular hyaluronan-binding protein 4-like n=1 Tax=Plectropomus leopardus TaxID=160734 RepID=UPI001C4CD7AA|nr:intracellular hyaluronan-binding protein 4-like [Plectropomus leopardus]XP_042344669.1 intracellular hyaluronan-binding protein 4-like [Plectropomus leopardus]
MLPDAYGCSVANRYGDLLDDDADPFDLISKVELEKEKKKKKEDEKKGKQKKPGQKESQKDRRVPVASDCQDPVTVRKQQQRRPGLVTESGDGREEAQRNTKRAAFGERRAIRQDNPQEFSIPKPSYNADSDQWSRGGIRGRRGARGGGGGGGGYTRSSDNFNLRGKREYDRHNGTGISPEEKRGGRGPWNWGSVEEGASELMEVTSDAPVKSEESQTSAEEDNQNRAMEEEDGEMVVQVAMEMTLDEWKALQETSRSKAAFNIRKAEDKIPSKAKVIHQSKHVENLKEGNLEDIEDEGNFLRRSVNDITSLLDINFGSLGRPSRGGRGRGARSGPASRPERVKPILEKEDHLAPNPDDPEDFPALSTGR